MRELVSRVEREQSNEMVQKWTGGKHVKRLNTDQNRSAYSNNLYRGIQGISKPIPDEDLLFAILLHLFKDVCRQNTFSSVCIRQYEYKTHMFYFVPVDASMKVHVLHL